MNLFKSDRIFLLLAAGMMLFTTPAEAKKEPAKRIAEISAQLSDPDTRHVLVAAHRGDWRGATENSLLGIQRAIDMGVDIIEIDVRKTADGEIILMHDATIDRTTTGKGKVSALTLAQIKKYFLRNGCGIKTQMRVPTLEEALLLMKDKVMVNIDKGYSIFPEVYAIAQKTGTEHQIIMKGSQPADQVIREFGPYLDKVFYMPIVDLDAPDAAQTIADHLEKLKPVAFELLFKEAGSDAPVQAKEQLAGRALIWYNTLWDGMAGNCYDDRALEDPDDVYGHLVDDLNTRIIQTDRPEFLLRYLEKRRRR